MPYNVQSWHMCEQFNLWYRLCVVKNVMLAVADTFRRIKCKLALVPAHSCNNTFMNGACVTTAKSKNQVHEQSILLLIFQLTR